MATDSQRAGDSPDSDDSMDGKRPNLSPEESADSDDSMDGKRPNLPAEERALLDKLLKMSNSFIRLYEELHPQLQQSISDLLTLSKKIVDKHSKIKELQRASRRTAVRAGVSIGLGAVALSILWFLLFDDPSVSDEFLTTVGAGAAFAVGFGVSSYISSKKIQNQLTEMFEKLKKVTKEFLTTVEKGASCQKNLCDLAEKILQCYSMFSQRKRQYEELKTRADALAELVQLFKPDDLWRFVKEKETFLWKEKLGELGPPVPLIVPRPGSRTIKDSKKKKKRRAAQERVRESQTGRPEPKMREAAKHLRKIVKEVKNSQSEVEKELLHKLRELIIQ